MNSNFKIEELNQKTNHELNILILKKQNIKFTEKIDQFNKSLYLEISDYESSIQTGNDDKIQIDYCSFFCYEDTMPLVIENKITIDYEANQCRKLINGVIHKIDFSEKDVFRAASIIYLLT